MALIGAAAVMVNGQGTSTAPIGDGIQILSPGGPDVWWVAQSQNTLTWTCQTTTITNFTVLVANGNPQVLTAPIAIIAQENNFVCSQTIGPDQINQPPATNYTIQFANPFNSTDIYVSSLPFEIKALGSTYPSSSATPTASFTASGTSSGTPSGSTASGSAASQSTGAEQSSGNGAIGRAVSGLGLMGAILAGFTLL